LPPFCGRSIAENTLKSLLPEMAAYGADNIVLVGGAGVMTYVNELVDILPSSARVSAVCDGCVLFDDALSEVGGASGACNANDAFSCTPDQTLPSAVQLWGAGLQESCGGWSCLLSSEALGQNGLVARTSAQLPLMAQHPLYDGYAYRARGIAPGADSTLDAAVRAQVLAGLQGAQVIVASACTEPQSSFVKGEFFSVTFGKFLLPPPTYASGLYSLVYRTGIHSDFMDSCEGAGCNPTCRAGGIFFEGSSPALVV